MSNTFRILIVDDNIKNLFSLRELLQTGLNKREIIEASSGEDALLRVVEHEVNLILLDIQMPGMDGFETARHLQMTERTRFIPIIFITAVFKAEEFIRRGYATGAVDYLTKPIDDNLLLNRIQLYQQIHERENKLNEMIKSLMENEKKLESALTDAKDANIANNAKTSFLTSMSHEIRTPLNSIIGLTDIVLKSKLNEQQAKFLGIAKAAGENLLFLINDILDLSRIETGIVELEKIPFSLSEQVENSISIIQIKAQEKKINLKWNIAPDVPNHFLGDPTRLRQVLLNILGNAVKFSDKGEVILSVKKTLSDLDLQFEIKDQGIGILPSKINSIFETFNQADSSMTRKYGGSGLGLAISKKIVELMHGKIWVHSEVDKGSTFFFTLHLPISPNISNNKLPLPQPNQINIDPQLPEIKPLKILLAEDSKDNQVLIEVYLLDQPHVMTLVENGEEAVQKFKQQYFDIVLMDIQMPIMDGYTATKEIRKWEIETKRPPTPILALTAHAFSEAVQASKNAGCTEHITKPILKAQLLQLLKKYSPSIV